MQSRGEAGRREAQQIQRAIGKLQGFIDIVENKKAMAVFGRIGEALVNYSKENGPWTDQTSNLRNSIAYEFLSPTSIVFFAAAEYAVFVEFINGYWVLSGSIEHYKHKIKDMLVEYLKVKPSDIKISKIKTKGAML